LPIHWRSQDILQYKIDFPQALLLQHLIRWATEDIQIKTGFLEMWAVSPKIGGGIWLVRENMPIPVQQINTCTTCSETHKLSGLVILAVQQSGNSKMSNSIVSGCDLLPNAELLVPNKALAVFLQKNQS